MSNPLASVDPNLPSSPPVPTSTPSSSRPIKLAPIFTRSYSSPRSSPLIPSSIAGPSSSPLTIKSHPNHTGAEEDGRSRKRVKLDVLTPLHPREESSTRRRRDVGDQYMDIDENDPCLPGGSLQEGVTTRVRPNIQDWFVTTPIRGESRPDHTNLKDVFGTRRLVPPKVEEHGMWRRKCRRGMISRNLMTTLQRPTIPTTPYLETLITRLTYCPDSPPSTLYIPSLHYWDEPRDHAPPLAVAFSNAAKIHSAYSAKSSGSRRLVVAAAEEGGVRIVDVDRPLGANPNSEGWFWRAHGNAVLDLKWSNDDSRILSASGDGTTRLHALDGPEPTLIASLTGHEASVKSCTFFDPTRSGVDPSVSSTVVATAGRDGNILIFDVRAPGNTTTTASSTGNRRSGRATRYSSGVDGFRPQIGGEINPVLEIKAAHETSKKKNPYSISSLLALQSMPGHLASGAAHEGVVRVWDPRFNTRALPHPTTSLPDPTCSTSSRRPRGIHSMVEQPSTGDIHLLSADSKIHVVRPSALDGGDEAIQPVRYTHSDLRSTYWMKISFSPCGRYLASGSSRGGMMTWDTQLPRVQNGMREVTATRISAGQVVCDEQVREQEVHAVDWGYDMIAACTEDSGVKIWRSDRDMSIKLRGDHGMKEDWAGMV